MSDAVVETRVVITNRYLKRPWVPTVIDRSGLTFIKIDKWDRELNMFITGQGLDLSKDGRRDINYKFIEELQKLRTAASDEAVQQAHALDDAMQEGQARKRQRKARQVDEDLVAPYLQITSPSVQRADGVVVDGITINVLFGVKNHPLWIERNAVNLEYLRQGALASKKTGEEGRRWVKRAKKGRDADEDGGQREGSEVCDSEAVPPLVVGEEIVDPHADAAVEVA